MPLLNFKPQFVDPIQSGRKHHTIRATRKIPVKPNDKLYLYCGARTKNCFLILVEPQTCTRVQTIEINSLVGDVEIIVDGTVLALDEMQQLARADGFENLTMFYHFWQVNHGDQHGHVNFTGQIIHWR